MRSKRPSGTSSLVTLLRALADASLTEVRDFQDPTALRLLPPVWQLAFRPLLRRARSPRLRQAFFNEKSGGRLDTVALRTRVLDDAWNAAHAGGTTQLVLLGAGLDGRAFRLDNVDDSSVFEVDHPWTQALKRQRAEGLLAKARRHVFVPVDFEKDSLSKALQAAQQRSDVPTFWIWEGVTPYLTRRAQELTLAAIAERSAAGTRLAMTYTEPPESKKESSALRPLLLLVRFFGEPFLGLLSQNETAELLTRAGFRTLEDTGVEDWRRKYSTNPSRMSASFRQRIVIAEQER